MIKPQQFTARFEECKELNDKFHQFSFELVKPARMEFLSGQYVSIKVDEVGIRRSYSICSRPDIDHGFELLLDITPMGKGTQFLKSLKFGDTMEILAPMGRLVLPDELTNDLLFVATGSGIAPFRSMIMDLLQVRNYQGNVTLFWGLREVQDMFWQEEFQELSQNFPNFKFHPVISRPVSEWTLCRGRVTDCLDVHLLPSQAQVFLCGNKVMIEDVKKLLSINPNYQFIEESFY